MAEAGIRRYRLLIVPGGNFVGIGNSLTPSTTANIRSGVQNGLNYLGICAGAFLAGSFPQPYRSLNLTSGVQFGFYAAGRGIRKTTVAITVAGGPTLDQVLGRRPAIDRLGRGRRKIFRWNSRGRSRGIRQRLGDPHRRSSGGDRKLAARNDVQHPLEHGQCFRRGAYPGGTESDIAVPFLGVVAGRAARMQRHRGACRSPVLRHRTQRREQERLIPMKSIQPIVEYLTRRANESTLWSRSIDLRLRRSPECSTVACGFRNLNRIQAVWRNAQHRNESATFVWVPLSFVQLPGIAGSFSSTALDMALDVVSVENAASRSRSAVRRA